MDTRSLSATLTGFGAAPTSAEVVVELGAMRLAQREIFRLAEGSCPFCGTRQKLGLAGKSFRLPRRVHCTRCGRELDLEEHH